MKIEWMRLRLTPARISWTWVPSPQSNRNTSPSRINAVDERPRVRVGTAELVPSRTIFKHVSLARESWKPEANAGLQVLQARSVTARFSATTGKPCGHRPHLRFERHFNMTLR